MRLPALVTLALAAASCTLNTDYFSEYRGKNLLSNYGFDAVESDGTTAKWALEEPDSTKTTTGVTAATFMNWTKASSDTALAALGSAYTTGPDGTSPAYRLEIKNLLPDGDFEAETDASTATAAPWSATGGTFTYLVNQSSNGGQTLTPTQTLSNRSMWWKSASGTDALTANLTAAVGGTWPMTSTPYRFRIDYMNLDAALPVSLFLDRAGATDLTWSPSSSATTYLTLWNLSQWFQVNAGNEALVFRVGNQAQDSILLDNAKLVPDISTLWVKTALPLLSSGSLTLLPGSKSGMYVFTVQVRDDPTVGTSDGRNRFAPSAVTIRLVAKVKSGTGSPAPTVFTRPPGGWTGWTTLTVNAGFDFVTEDSAQTGNAFTVEVSPTNTSTDAVDAGAVLVAQPTLSFNP